MTLDERLAQLAEAADELAADVQADDKLYSKIRYQAAKASAGSSRPRWQRLAWLPATAVALIVLTVTLVPVLRGSAPLEIRSVTAGGQTEAVPLPSTRADLPAGSVSVGNASDIPAFQNLWAGNSDTSFPMVLVNGSYYRLLSSPKKLSNKLLGQEIGTVEHYTPEMNGSGFCSNTVLQGETVYSVQGMGTAVIAASIDGNIRVFQQVTANGNDSVPQKLSQVIPASGVSELSLSGVGRIKERHTAESLVSTLLGGAAYQGSGCSRTSQVLHIKYTNGITLQMYVRGQSLSASGTWSCPAFFEQFEAALR